MATESADRRRQLMPPPPARPRLNALQLPGDQGLPKAVLPEEDYSDAVAAIIERDYFPDIPKLRNQLEWAQAVKSGDPTVIRQAQINIARRRAGLMTPQLASHGVGSQTPGTGMAANTPAAGWGVTPAATVLRTPAMTPLAGAATGATVSGMAGGPGATPLMHAGQDGTGLASPAAAPADQLRAPPMSLDTFLSTHTSEDNASFAKIHTKDLARKRLKVSHHLENKNTPLLLEGPGANPQDGYGTGGQQPHTLVPTTHNPHNSLYYPPSQKPLSVTEAEDIAKRPPKQINVRGTRLKQADDGAAAAATAAVAAAVAAATGRPATGAGGSGAAIGAGLDYSRLATPALTPGALGMSPLMTWGDIASTPLRLDGEDGIALDPAALAGPKFEVPSQPKREQVGHELAAAKSLGELKRRQREARKAAALPAGLGSMLAGSTPTPRLGTGGERATPVRPWSGAATPGGGTGGLSAAAQKLAKQLSEKKARMGSAARGGVGGQESADRMLRASYKGSGRPTPARGVTPQLQQPRVGSKPAIAVAAAAGSTPAAAGVAAGKSITDDLLKL